jgi:hypothetical protein
VAHHVQLFTDNAVDQQPVRFDVGVAVALPVARQGMVLIPLWQSILGQEQQDQLA